MEKKKNIMLRITCVQRDEGGEEETISLESPGVFTEDAAGARIDYDETELTGMGGTHTTLLLSEGRVELVRSGAFVQQMEYREGRSTRSMYPTPMGNALLLLKTDKLENTVKDGAGRLRIVYELELKNMFHHLNELVIDVREDTSLHGSER